MKLNFKSAAFLLMGVSPLQAEEQSPVVNLRHLSCLLEEMQGMATDERTDSYVSVENKRDDFIFSIDAENWIFRNVVTGEYELKNTFSISVSPDGSFDLRAQAQYEESDSLIRGDEYTMYIASQGDTFITDMNQRGFDRLRGIARRCL